MAQEEDCSWSLVIGLFHFHGPTECLPCCSSLSLRTAALKPEPTLSHHGQPLNSGILSFQCSYSTTRGASPSIIQIRNHAKPCTQPLDLARSDTGISNFPQMKSPVQGGDTVTDGREASICKWTHASRRLFDVLCSRHSCLFLQTAKSIVPPQQLSWVGQRL